MSFESSLSQIGGGGALLAGLVYVGASLWAGQSIGARMIDKADWSETCAAGIKARYKPDPAPVRRLPEQRCADVMGGIFPELGAFCHQLGNPDFNAQARRLAEQARARKRALQERRLDKAMASAGSQCSCARNVYLSDQMIPLGLHAGTARMITPAAVSAMSDELKQAFATPRCQALGGAS